VASNEPDGYKDAKGNVAGGCEAEVFKRFGSLEWNISLSPRISQLKIFGVYYGSPGQTYRKNDIYNIHNAQNYVTNPHLVIPITHEDESARDDMVRKHLCVVLPSFFNIHYENLLQAESKLD